MTRLRHGRFVNALRCACIVVAVAGFSLLHAQTGKQNTAGGQSLLFDRVIAVVNRQTILASDLEDEMQLSVLEPSRNLKEDETPQQALDHLISRALIQQQIQQENVPVVPASPAEIAGLLKEIRTELPACTRANCQSDTGWAAFLQEHDLSPARVENYLRSRSETLSFVELRFQQGIRITPEEIETYYRETLLPQYPVGQPVPPLQQVSSRIGEILLQQRVNDLFGTWLTNLRKQGQIEVLDPALAADDDDKGDGITRE